MVYGGVSFTRAGWPTAGILGRRDVRDRCLAQISRREDDVSAFGTILVSVGGSRGMFTPR